MNEKLIERKLVDGVKKLGGWALKFWPITFTGFPDRIVILPGGRIHFVELKTTGADLKPRQKIVIPKLIKMGCSVFVIDSQDLLNEFFKKVANGN